MTSFLELMRSNNYKTDPLSHGSPWDAICSRGDLASSPSPGGCLDGKASMASLWKERRAFAVNGPTQGGAVSGELPAFSWTQFPDTPHAGLPLNYENVFEPMLPAWV